MSISATLQQAAADKAQQEQDARLTKVNEAFNKMADELPAVLKEMAEAAQLHLKPATGLSGYFKNRAANSAKKEHKRAQKLNLSLHDTGLNTVDYFLPEGLEKFSGYRRLREYCALPEVDIALAFHVSHGSASLAVQPTQPFSASKVTYDQNYYSDYYYDDDDDVPYKPPVNYSIPEFLNKNAGTLAPPQVAAKINVMSPLKLKG